MNTRNSLIFGVALVLALTVGIPGASQAQRNDPGVSYAPAAQTYAGYSGYNGSGYAYCPMGGYGYAAPASQNYRHHASRSWNRGYQGGWCPWNSGYVRGHHRGWGCGW